MAVAAATDRVVPRPSGEGAVVVVIPTLNEEASIGEVVRRLPRDLVRRVIVADGGSSDATVVRAKTAGADVVAAGSGYGRACLTAAMAADDADILVFMDGDGADDPTSIAALVEPIRAGRSDFVIGSRARGEREPGSVAWHQLAAGRLAGFGMRLLYGVRYTDMCAFRAIRRDVLLALGMREMTYGWNIEMQMRAARAGLRILEVPVDYHRRSGGTSKVAGSLRGTLRAGARIVATFVRVAAQPMPRPPRPNDWRKVAGALLLGLFILLAPALAQARDLVVYGEPTLEKTLRAIGQLWQARTGTRVNVFVAPSDLSFAQIDRGARCDVIFALAGAGTDDAARRKTIDAGTVRPVVRNGLVLVGNRDAGPASATPADLSRLVAGKKLAISNPDRDVAGAYAVDILRKLGIAVDDDSKSVAVAESSAGVVDLLATGKARLGIVYATDAAGQPGFKLALPLSGFDHPPIDYVAAVASDPKSDTRPFLAFLKSPEAKATFTSSGLQAIDEQVGAQR
ncbi:MAG: molybdate ABC transporter substrate-binding protein [Xanthobacteraceae bacterium]